MKNPRKIIVVLVLFTLLASIFGSYATATERPYKTGALFVSPEEYSRVTGFKFVPITATYVDSQSSTIGTTQTGFSVEAGEPEALQEDEIYHTGDLIVEGNETYVIENVKFWIKGNIHVKDNAKLIIKNSYVIIHDSYKDEFCVSIRDKAQLIVENSVLNATYLVPADANIPIPMADFVATVEDNATVIMKNTYSHWRFAALEQGKITIESSKVPSVWVTFSSQVNITDSIIYRSILLQFRDEDQDIELSGLTANQRNLSLYYKLGNGFLILENTYVSSWEIDLTHHFKKNLTIKDSHIKLIQLNFDEYVRISNIKPGYFDNWNIHQNVQGHTLWNLTLTNVTVEGWKLITLNDAYIDNYEGILDPWNDKEVIVINSYVNLDGRGSRYLKLVNTTVNNIRLHYGPIPKGGPASANFSIEFVNSIIEGYIEIALNHAFFRGNVSFRLGSHSWLLHEKMPLENVNFQKGMVIREYPLFVKDENGDPAYNASISLYSPEGELISSRVTNEKGVALFNITFTKENYDKKWNLKIVYNGMTFFKEVSFLTSTPIVFSFKEITKQVENEISYAEKVVNWVKKCPNVGNLEEAKELLHEARIKYFEGELYEALKLSEEVINLLWIKTDGDANDWYSACIEPLVVDPEGDAVNASGDIKSLSAIVDGRYLHLKVEVYDKNITPQIFSIELKTDNSGEYFIMVVDKSKAILINQLFKQEQYPIESSYDKVLEIKVPLQYIGNPKRIQIGVYTGPAPPNHIDMIEPFWNKVIYLSIDNAPPKAEISSPANGSLVSGLVTIVLDYSDAHIHEVRLYINGILRFHINSSQATGSHEYRYQWDTRLYSDGAYNITLVVMDVIGRAATDTVVVYVDNTPPVVEVTNPGNGSYVGGEVSVEYTVEEPNLHRVLLVIGHLIVDITGEHEYTLDTTQLADGEHTITLRVTDKAGNEHEETVVIFVDNTPPEVIVEGLIDGELVVASDTLKLAYAIEDPSFESAALHAFDREIQLEESGIITLDVSGVPDGEYQAYIVTADKAGNTASKRFTIRVERPVTTTPPATAATTATATEAGETGTTTARADGSICGPGLIIGLILLSQLLRKNKIR